MDMQVNRESDGVVVFSKDERVSVSFEQVDGETMVGLFVHSGDGRPGFDLTAFIPDDGAELRGKFLVRVSDGRGVWVEFTGAEVKAGRLLADDADPPDPTFGCP